MYRILGASCPFDPHNTFVSSPVFSASLLATVRLTFALYALATLVTVLAWDSIREHTGNTFFSEFTWLSWTGLCAYFWAAGVQTFAYALNQRRKGQRRSLGVGYPLQRWPRFLQLLHVLLFSTVTTFPILVTIVYWSVLFPQNGFTTRFSVWSNISAHDLNTAFALFELVFTNTPPAPWTLLPFLVLMLAGYLGVAYISHAKNGIYPYNFLDPKKQGARLAGWIIGIAFGACVIFVIARLLWMLRVRLVYRYSTTTTAAAAAATANEAEAEDERIVMEEASGEWIEVDAVEPGAPRSSSPAGRAERGRTEKEIGGKEGNAVGSPSA